MVNWLDITTAVLGLAYILLEYRASVWMWAVGAVMQLLGIVLYYQKGLYADCGMEFYYLAMTAYGAWRWMSIQPPKASSRTPRGDELIASEVTAEPSVHPRRRQEETQGMAITHIPPRLALLWTAIFAVLWALIWYLLATLTDSTVPVADAFTTALSLVGIWALAHKYLEQWLVWIAVDVVTCWLYFTKDIPFKASLYGFYVVIAIAGYRRWRRRMNAEQ